SRLDSRHLVANGDRHRQHKNLFCESHLYLALALGVVTAPQDDGHADPVSKRDPPQGRTLHWVWHLELGGVSRMDRNTRLPDLSTEGTSHPALAPARSCSGRALHDGGRSSRRIPPVISRRTYRCLP